MSVLRGKSLETHVAAMSRRLSRYRRPIEEFIDLVLFSAGRVSELYL